MLILISTTSALLEVAHGLGLARYSTREESAEAIATMLIALRPE